ncbi:hypothetical protein Ait01nite_046520 [Actinoplanes italicus]|uniref:DNA polymerase IV n=1 Tax=Actinoplanes italicus TaxID=113567 RepID=A0A2T0K9E3_9ACTN|nr:DNA polymerase IV [Actinoplanes italicus]PRX19757.1 nucleotidyltransferase/DNA polymerase involved in DNA repair [Actinoplanes italicus]GIE31607.1 hypothetical protein Ait01nite_046520 [Actinoplanes italicus]
MRREPSILHVDLDAMFAAVEQRDKVSLRGKPVIVGGVAGRGVVSTASYEARAYGAHSAMPMAQARRLCPPNTAFLSPRFPAYQRTSKVVMALLAEVSPLVEQVSIDEAYVDLAVTGHDLSLTGVTELAGRLKTEIAIATGGVTGSIGAASSKLLAKIGSDLNKPDGLTIVPAGAELDVLHPLPVRRLGGVGPATEQRLHRAGVRTVGHLAAVPLDDLIDWFGTAHGHGLFRLARAEDNRPVVSEREAKSVSAEETFDVDLTDPARLNRELDLLAARVAGRLSRSGLTGRTVNIKVRHPDFTTVTRAITRDQPTDDGRLIAQLARRLLAELDTSGGVRLLGVGVSTLADFAQDDLFTAAGEDPPVPSFPFPEEDTPTLFQQAPTAPPPAVSLPSSAVIPSSSAVIPSSPAVIPSSPPVIPSSSAVVPSSPAAAQSSPAGTELSPDSSVLTPAFAEIDTVALPPAIPQRPPAGTPGLAERLGPSPTGTSESPGPKRSASTAPAPSTLAAPTPSTVAAAPTPSTLAAPGPVPLPSAEPTSPGPAGLLLPGPAGSSSSGAAESRLPGPAGSSSSGAAQSRLSGSAGRSSSGSGESRLSGSAGRSSSGSGESLPPGSLGSFSSDPTGSRPSGSAESHSSGPAGSLPPGSVGSSSPAPTGTSLPGSAEPSSSGPPMVPESDPVGLPSPSLLPPPPLPVSPALVSAGRSATPGTPVPAAVPIWRPGQDVRHEDYGAGWVRGSGVGRVTVRFEGPHTPPGPVRTFFVDDPKLQPADPPDWIVPATAMPS